MNLINQAQIIKFHSDRLREFSNDYQRLGWKTSDSQLIRFGVLASSFNLDGASVLDVGCGYADFKTFIDNRFSGVSYTGIDLMPAFIHEAARRFASDHFARFIFGDFATTNLTEVDYVFSCGALSYRNPDPGFNFRMIRKMWDMARKGIALSLLDREVFSEHPLLVGYNKTRVLTFCRSISETATLIDGYCPDDFTIKISK
jgi:SAM-dependent methyltransferase